MKKIVLPVCLLIIGFSLTSNAEKSNFNDVGFAAPTYNDHTQIVDPEIGAIVLNKTDDKFYGNTDGTHSGWVSFTPEDEPIITCWQSYTPTWTASTSNPTLGTGALSGKWRRVGDSMELKIHLNTNGVTGLGSGNWLFSLPDDPDSSPTAPYEVDQNKVITDSSSDAYLGVAHMRDADLSTYYTFSSVINDPLNSSNILLKGSTGTVTPSFPFTWSGSENDTLVIKATIPILNWKTKTPTMSLACS